MLTDKHTEVARLIDAGKAKGYLDNQNTDLDELLTTVGSEGIDTIETQATSLGKIGIHIDAPTSQTDRLKLVGGDLAYVARGMTHNQVEIIAKSAIEAFTFGCAKIQSKAESIAIIRFYFKIIRNQTEMTIAGCRTFEQFCTERLGRTSRAVRYMLSGRPSQAKRIQKPVEIIKQDSFTAFVKASDQLVEAAAEVLASGGAHANDLWYMVGTLGTRIIRRLNEILETEKDIKAIASKTGGVYHKI